MSLPFIDPQIRYIGSSKLRRFSEGIMEKMTDPVVIKKQNGDELAVLVPWKQFLWLQEMAAYGAKNFPQG